MCEGCIRSTRCCTAFHPVLVYSTADGAWLPHVLAGVQLDVHPDCPGRTGGRVQMRYVHVVSAHMASPRVEISFCECAHASLPAYQLVHLGLFPATISRPGTAFSLDMLRTFDRLNRVVKRTSAYGFYEALFPDPSAIGKVRVTAARRR